MLGHRRLAVIVLATTVVWACGSIPPSPSTTNHDTASAPSAASTQAASTTAFRPHFDAAPCPADVTESIVLQISCGYLTVLEDRAKPDGRTIQLFVIRVEPPGGTTTVDPVIAIGNLARQDEYGGLASVGQKTHRIAYLLDLRGVGHSKPSLDCPEVAAVWRSLACDSGIRPGARRSSAESVAAMTVLSARASTLRRTISKLECRGHRGSSDDARDRELEPRGLRRRVETRLRVERRSSQAVFAPCGSTPRRSRLPIS